MGAHGRDVKRRHGNWIGGRLGGAWADVRAVFGRDYEGARETRVAPVARQGLHTCTLDTVASLCRRLLGETAVADHKTASGRLVTLLGWDIDSAQVLVTIAEKNTLEDVCD